MKRSQWFLVAALTLSAVCIQAWTNDARAEVVPCVGDCDGDYTLTVSELVTGVNMALERLPVDNCPEFDPGGDERVGVNELVAAVNNALAGCGAGTNRAPRASDVSFGAETATAYVEKQLIGSDPDNDTITFELVADESDVGYSFAYVNPESGMLYLTIAPDFEGTIELPYRVTDGSLFSNIANVTVEVSTEIVARNSGLQDVSPEEYASFPRGFYHGALLGAPGANPTLPSSVDLSQDFPIPGNQGRQNSCVAWALGYAIRTYQERVELGWSLEPAEHRFSPAYMYNLLNGGTDNGLVYHESLDFIVENGVATLARMSYNEDDFLTQPNAAAHQEAAQFKAKSWKAANGILEVKEALANRLPVFMVIQLMDGIYGLRGPDSVYNTFGGAWHTGHGVAAVGYDDNRYGGAFKIMNSWGQQFGDGGFFWLPYTAANYIVQTGDLGPRPVLTGSLVIEDLPDPYIPDPDPVDPTPPAQSPDLQVTDWSAYFDGTPGGSGSLQYTITNTGIAPAPAGAYVALILSHDPTFSANDILVVYESIPFQMAPGSTAYRDANNSIAFFFPGDLAPGEYYMALAVDIWDDVVEAKEDDNISPSTTLVEIENTLPDMEVQSWYARWDGFGNGALTYDIVNNGASTAPAGWLISLVLSPNYSIGDGDELFLFDEAAAFDIDPGGSLYRNESAPGSFSIFYDHLGYPVPTGEYYIALWVDSNDYLAESNKGNNASLSWGTVAINNGIGARGSRSDPRALLGDGSPSPGEAYNGKVLPGRQASVRRVRISDTAQRGRQMELLDGDAAPESGPRVKAAESHRWSKQARARQQVIFPTVEMKPMPNGN